MLSREASSSGVPMRRSAAGISLSHIS